MATGDSTLDGSAAMSGHPDAPAPVDHDADAPHYFHLIVECAKAALGEKPSGDTWAEFWSDRVHREWVHVNSMLTSKPPRPVHGNAELTAEYYAAGLGRLAREALMAAWHLGTFVIEQNDDPEYAEWSAADVLSDIIKSV